MKNVIDIAAYDISMNRQEKTFFCSTSDAGTIFMRMEKDWRRKTYKLAIYDQLFRVKDLSPWPTTTRYYEQLINTPEKEI